MYILTRYVVWEVLKLFVVALIGLTLVVTIGMVFQEGMKKGLPALVMLRITPYMLPEMLGITIPVAMLYSVCSVFGRMTGTNEIVAVKSLGINPMALVWPVLLLAAFLSLGTVWMYEIAATWCRPSFQRIIYESIEEIAYGVLQKETSFSGEQFPFSITVKRVIGRRLIRPTIILKGEQTTTLTAAEAELETDRSNPDAPVLWLIYTNSRMEIDGAIGWSNRLRERYPVLINVPPPDHHHRDWVAMRNIPTAIDELQVEIANLEKQKKELLSMREYYKKANKILNIVEPRDNVEEIVRRIEEKESRIYRLQAEPYRRWSNGFTCLCFALVGMPVAMLWRHADGLTNFFVCFLPILAIYYPLLMLSETLATSGMTPILFWMGNIVLAIPAIALLRWINGH